MKTKVRLTFLMCVVSFSLMAQRKIEVIAKGNEALKYALTFPEGFDKNKRYPLLLLPGEADEPNIYIEGAKEKHGWVIIESPINIKHPDIFETLIQRIEQKVKIFTITIVGFSANSSGAFNLASRYPDIINNIVGMPGNPSSGTRIENYKKTSVLFIAGENDTFWLNNAKMYHQKFEAANIKSKIEVIKGGGHILHEIKGDKFFQLIEYLKTGNIN